MYGQSCCVFTKKLTNVVQLLQLHFKTYGPKNLATYLFLNVKNNPVIINQRTAFFFVYMLDFWAKTKLFLYYWIRFQALSQKVFDRIKPLINIPYFKLSWKISDNNSKFPRGMGYQFNWNCEKPISILQSSYHHSYKMRFITEY